MKSTSIISIQNYKWKIEFVSVLDLPKENDGITLYNERRILIRDDLDEVTTECVLRHEITHAILCVQGRWSQNSFTQEEVCEFIGFQTPTINELVKEVLL